MKKIAPARNGHEKNGDIKNIRLTIPVDVYKRIKKYQARKILEDQPELSLAQVCVELLDKGTKRI
jgi:hypothetical protein